MNDNRESSTFSEDECEVISSQFYALCRARDDLESAFGDLEENRRHPGFWDKLYIVFSGKYQDRTCHGVVGKNYNFNGGSEDSSSEED